MADTIRTIPPKRRPGRWVRRALLLLIVGLIAAYVTWGFRAQHRVAARLAALHAAGELVYPADFELPVPPPGQNAADELIQAGALAAASKELADYDRSPNSAALPLTDDERRLIAAAVSANRPALNLIDSALRKPCVRWPAQFEKHPAERNLTWLNDLRAAARLLRIDALLAQQEGRGADALRRARQTLAFAERVDHHRMLVPHLVATGIAAMTADTVEDIACHPHLASTAAEPDRAIIIDLIAALLDEQTFRTGLDHALQSERNDASLWMSRLLEGERDFTGCGPRISNAVRPLYRMLSRPFVMDNIDLAVRMNTAHIESFRRSTNWPTARADAAVAAISAEIDRRPTWNCLASVFTTGNSRPTENEYRCATDRRLAATALAIRLYTADHAGHRPPTLAALVPAYLPAVPLDPMAQGPRPLQYLPDRAILYSIGLDTHDDAGSEDLRAGVKLDLDKGEPIPRWSARDALLHLDPQPRYIRLPSENDAINSYPARRLAR